MTGFHYILSHLLDKDGWSTDPFDERPNSGILSHREQLAFSPASAWFATRLTHKTCCKGSMTARSSIGSQPEPDL